jgi:predicted acyltransferase
MDPHPSAIATNRVVCIDAWRGFDMFWIMGGKPLVLALEAAMIHANEPPEWLKAQLEHTHWVGFTCYDLIMPLFMFIDLLRWRAWAFPFVVIGAYALFTYMVSHLFGAQISGMSGVLFTGLAGHLQPFGLSSFTWSFGYVLIRWLMFWFLYRNKLFWRV